MGKIFWEYWLVFLGFLGLLLIGAIGSALWDVVLKPFSSWALRKFLSIATLGIGHVKRNVYKKIALEYEDSFIRFITYWLIMVVSVIVLVGIVSFKTDLIDSFTRQRIECEKMLKQIEAPIKPKRSIEEKKEELKSRILQTKKEVSEGESSATIFFLLMVPSLMFAIFMFWTHFAILCYISNAVRYFNYLLRVCGPFIEELERLKYLSSFALIDSPQAYKELIFKLQEVAKNHGCVLDGFKVWE